MGHACCEPHRTRLGYFIYGRGLGGNGRYVLNLVERLDPNLYDVIVYVYCPPCDERDQFEKRLRELGARVQRMNSEGLPDIKNPKYEARIPKPPEELQENKNISKFEFRNSPACRPGRDFVKALKVTWYYFKLIRKIREFFKSENLHVLHISLGGFPTLMHVVVAGLSAKIRRVVMIVHIMEAGQTRWIDRYLTKKIVQSGIPTIALSNMMKKELIRRFYFKENQIKVVYNGVDINFYVPGAQHANGQGPQKVLIPARLAWVKGHGVLFEAIVQNKSKFQNTRFLLAGEGPDQAQLEAEVRKLGIEPLVQFLGFRKDLKELIQDSDVVALSSFNEGFPFVLLEAMACEKPVVTTNAGAVEEMIEEGKTGYIVNIKDSEALGKALLKVLDAGPQIRSQMGKFGRKRVVESFSLEQMVRNTVALYD